MSSFKLKKLTCKRCGHKWFPRKPKKPMWCPHCGTYLWNKVGESKTGRPRTKKGR